MEWCEDANIYHTLQLSSLLANPSFICFLSTCERPKSVQHKGNLMNNDLVKIDATLSHLMEVKPNIDRLAANEGKEDARRD